MQLSMEKCKSKQKAHSFAKELTVCDQCTAKKKKKPTPSMYIPGHVNCKLLSVLYP